MAKYQITTDKGVYEIETQDQQVQQVQQPQMAQPEPMTLKGFGKNTINDILNNARGLGDIAKNVATYPLKKGAELGQNIGQAITDYRGNKSVVVPGYRNKKLIGDILSPLKHPADFVANQIAPVNDMAKGIGQFAGQIIQHPIKTAYDQPLSTAMMVAPFAPKGLKVAGKAIDATGITRAGRLAKIDPLVKKATEIYRDVLKPTQGEVNTVEIRGGKNIEDYYRLAAEEKLKITKTTDNKLDTKAAINQIAEKQKLLYDEITPALENSTAKINLYDVSQEAKIELKKKYKNALDYKDAIKDVEDYIGAEIEKYGTHKVSMAEANVIKQGMWQAGYKLMKPTAKASARTLGHIVKEAIEKHVVDAPVKALNEMSGKYETLMNLLESADGRVIKGGRLGSYVAQAIGAGIGAAAGSVIPVAGTLGGGLAGRFLGSKVQQALTNPARLSAKGASIMGRAQKYMTEQGRSPFNPIKGLEKLAQSSKSKIPNVKEPPIVPKPEIVPTAADYLRKVEDTIWKPLSRGSRNLTAKLLNDPALFEAYKKSVNPSISLEKFNELTMSDIEQAIRQIKFPK